MSQETPRQPRIRFTRFRLVRRSFLPPGRHCVDDKDGLIMDLQAAEITARTGRIRVSTIAIWRRSSERPLCVH